MPFPYWLYNYAVPTATVAYDCGYKTSRRLRDICRLCVSFVILLLLTFTYAAGGGGGIAGSHGYRMHL